MVLPLITPLFLLQVGSVAYILDRVINTRGEGEDGINKQESDNVDKVDKIDKTDNVDKVVKADKTDKVDKVNDTSNNRRRDECIYNQRVADADRAKIWKMIEVRRLEANGRLRLIEINKANMSNQHKDTRTKRKPIVGIPEQRIRKIPIIDEALISMLKPT